MQHKLQIEFIHSKSPWFPGFFKSAEIIQAKAFWVGFRFTNIGDAPLIGASLTDIHYKSADGKDFAWSSEKSFHLDTINPNEQKELWIGRAGTYAHGLCDINLNVTPDTAGDTIKTFQVNPFTKIVSPAPRINSWIAFFFIRSKSEYEQSQTNIFLIAFTLVLVALTAATLQDIQLQTRPILDQYSRNEIQARQTCTQDPKAQVPLSDGRMVDCSSIFPDLIKK